MNIEDPVERIVAEALAQAGVRFERGQAAGGLDFVLPDHGGTKIECKRYYTGRISAQLAAHGDVILIQGLSAALAFARLVGRGTLSEAIRKPIGRSYRAPDGRIYFCESYEFGPGYWMTSESSEDASRRTCVSELAIGRTFHAVHEPKNQ